jgi:hypothetical protein
MKSLPVILLSLIPPELLHGLKRIIYATSTQASTAQLAWHLSADFGHRNDDFIDGDQVIKTGQCHVGCSDCIGGGHRVLAQTRRLDAVGDRITTKA